jgi:anti-sigma B factor antagonist
VSFSAWIGPRRETSNCNSLSAANRAITHASFAKSWCKKRHSQRKAFRPDAGYTGVSWLANDFTTLAAKVLRVDEGGEAMTRVEGIQAQATLLSPEWRAVDARCAAEGSLRMSCHAIQSNRLDGRNPWIIRIAGDVDCTTSGELREEIAQLLTADNPDRLILDLEGVTHMDSSGLGALLAGLRDANSRHVRFTLSGLNSALRHTLERTKLFSLFEIRPTVQEALLA